MFCVQRLEALLMPLQYSLERIFFCFSFAGLFVGALIRYAATKTTATHLTVEPDSSITPYNQSLPPDTLWLAVI